MMTEKRKRWTEEELIIVFNLYLKMPFGQMNRTDSRVIHMAELIDRTPSSIAMRLGNFASVDPYHINRGIKGLQGGMNQVKPIFDRFVDKKDRLRFLSEQIESKLSNKKNEIGTLKNRIIRVKKKELKNYFSSLVKDNFKVQENLLNPFLITEKTKKTALWIFLKNISPTYFNDQARIQVASSVHFNSIKSKKYICIPIGYDLNNDCFVAWDPIIFLSRINNKKNISIYSKYDEHVKAAKRKEINKFHLSNNDLVYTFPSTTLSLFLKNINHYFNLKEVNLKVQQSINSDTTPESKDELPSIPKDKKDQIAHCIKNNKTHLAIKHYIDYMSSLGVNINITTASESIDDIKKMF